MSGGELDLFSVKLVLPPLYYVRLVVCTVLLVPLRIIFLVLSAVTSYILTRLVTVCLSDTDLQSPLPVWRRAVRRLFCSTAYLWYWSLGFW